MHSPSEKSMKIVTQQINAVVRVRESEGERETDSERERDIGVLTTLLVLKIT